MVEVTGKPRLGLVNVAICRNDKTTAVSFDEDIVEDMDAIITCLVIEFC